MHGWIDSVQFWQWQGPMDCLNGACLYLSRRGTALITSENVANLIPGKGVGLVAGRTIREGEVVVLSEPPTVVVRLAAHVQLENKYIANYLDMARVNHDCRPNIVYRYDNMHLTAFAARDITAGEEFSVSYIEELKPRAERLSRLQKLENRIETVVMPETGEQLVALYAQERLHAFKGSAYRRAALNFAMFGLEEEARDYARIAVEALMRELGPESNSTISTKLLASSPRDHWAWRWRLLR
ncbi:hypothetical protein BJ878DRAFT_537389 [Calycina marina]|uniref:SET domain-containing protein n=1 Tax=Calycina marina TaxID=1763456 RepID=A0A9P8CAY1_9HELO|nr:hypothetical protein BJ878DRAFT_537389 [Calycina marina]